MAPAAARYVVVGAGVHGLSTAWHLASQLRVRGQGDGTDVVVLDKTGAGAGASGIACGVVRNNYFQPARRRLMARSVSLWDSNPDGLACHPVGYEQACHAYMRGVFAGWQATGVSCLLHEHRGGFAHNQTSLRALAARAEREGVRILSGVRVRGLELPGSVSARWWPPSCSESRRNSSCRSVSPATRAVRYTRPAARPSRGADEIMPSRAHEST